jgi:hypothetical protein
MGQKTDDGKHRGNNANLLGLENENGQIKCRRK